MERSKLQVGVDVPWVTSWTAEPVFGVGPCPTTDGRLSVLQRERPGYGKPQYSMNHHVRQRASVRGLLCPMCGRPTPQGDRWSLTAHETTAGALRRGALAFAVPADIEDARVVLNAGAISPGHLACMERSHRLCPHLAADANAELRPFPETWYVSLLQITPEPAPAHAALRLAPAPPAPPVVAFLQLCGITARAVGKVPRRLK